MRVGIIAVLVLTFSGLSGVPTVIPQPPLLWNAKATGYFHTDYHNGIWWLIDPAGHPTLSIGVDNVSYTGDPIRGTGPSPYLEAVRKSYRDRGAWDQMALQRFSAWGFNTLGAWSDRRLWRHDLPYTIILDFAARAGADPARGVPVDVYDPRFAATARAIAEREAASRARDPLLLGYFSDNELWWGSDWRRRDTMLAAYLALPAGAPGRAQAIEFLRGRYGGTIQRLNRAWHVNAPDFLRVPRTAWTAAYRDDAAAFLALVANRYFAVSAGAIHAADPQHLYLGARFVGLPPAAVLRAASAADVVSINLYTRDPRSAVRRAYAFAGRPVLVSEFSFRALDSGLPNTVGAGPWVFDQRNRAMAFLSYVIRLEGLPEAIGYHWFRWADEPALGRADGENSNYGLVAINDSPYGMFVDAISAVNRAAVAVHSGMKIAPALQERVAWYPWSIHDVLAVLLGTPRWFSTAIRALREFLTLESALRSAT